MFACQHTHRPAAPLAHMHQALLTTQLEARPAIDVTANDVPALPCPALPTPLPLTPKLQLPTKVKARAQDLTSPPPHPTKHTNTHPISPFTMLQRPTKVKVKAQDLTGRKFTISLRCVCGGACGGVCGVIVRVLVGELSSTSTTTCLPVNLHCI